MHIYVYAYNTTSIIYVCVIKYWSTATLIELIGVADVQCTPIMYICIFIIYIEPIYVHVDVSCLYT